MQLCFLSCYQVIQEREDLLRQIELAGDEMWRNGTVEDWFSEADLVVRKVGRFSMFGACCCLLGWGPCLLGFGRGEWAPADNVG